MENTCNNCQKLKKLQDEIKELKNNSKNLHPTLAKGIQGEKLMLSLTRGQGALTMRSASSDMILNNGERVEIKFSTLHTVKHKSKVEGKPDSTYYRGSVKKLLQIPDPRFSPLIAFCSTP